MRRRVLDSTKLAELRRQRRRSLRIKIIIVSLLIVATFVAFGFIARTPSIRVASFNISGNKLIETSEVESLVSSILSGKYLWLYPKNNIFLLPRRELKESIMQQFKRAEDVSININAERVLSIRISERGAQYTWCGNTLPALVESSNDKCYFLDEFGYIFDEAPYFSGATYLKFYGGLGEMDNPVGQRILPTSFEKLVYLQNVINQTGFNVSSVVIDPKGEIDMYLAAFTTPPDAPKIILKIDSDVEKLAENLQAAVSAEPFKTELKNNYNNLNYIDLRFGNKVYYKFR